jgi:hypothetical protein
VSSTNKPKVFLAGATGYIGSRVLDALLGERPDLEVVALSRRAEAAAALRAKGATPVIGDLTVPGDWIAAAREADHVIHVAQPAAFNERATRTFGLRYERERLEQDRALFAQLDAARRQRIVYVSGHSYFGETGRARLGDETMTPHPIGFGPYIIAAVENVRREVARGLDIVSVYPGAVYAYGSWTKLYVIDRLRDDKKLMAMPGESALCSPIHVRDCARAVAHMLTLSDERVARLGRDYLLNDNRPVSYEDLNAAFAQALGKTPRYFKVPGFLAKLMMGEITYNYQVSNCAYSNRRLLDTGFAFEFPTIAEGAPDIVEEARRAWAKPA